MSLWIVTGQAIQVTIYLLNIPMSARKFKSQIGSIPKIVNNFKPKTDNQKLFHQKICNFDHQLILCHGIAGTGKTYVSIYKALQDVLRRGTPYEKLIIINPTVDVGKEDALGFSDPCL